MASSYTSRWPLKSGFVFGFKGQEYIAFMCMEAARSLLRGAAGSTEQSCLRQLWEAYRRKSPLKGPDLGVSLPVGGIQDAGFPDLSQVSIDIYEVCRVSL